MGAGLFEGLLHLAKPQGIRLSVVLADLATQQIERLDAVRALVNHIQAVVPPILFHGEIPGVAIAAQHLDVQAVGFVTPFARPALRSEERRVGKECVSTCRSRWSPYH